MLFNLDLIITILAIIIFVGLSAFTIYIILPISFISSISNIKANEGFFTKFNLALIRLSSIGTISVRANNKSTEVELNDEELNSLLDFVFRETGNSYQISAAYLDSLGLYTETVVKYLEALGCIIT
jgi:hypothetical protein